MLWFYRLVDINFFIWMGYVGDVVYCLCEVVDLWFFGDVFGVDIFWILWFDF